MSNASWKSQFTQPISGFDPVEAQGLSELGYALRHHQIPEAEYLQWARENFELASLDMKFFQSTRAPRQVFEKCKDAYSWGPECLPVGEWEDHLLIAGLQKPDDIPNELNAIFFLAPISGLLEYWTQYQEEASEISSDEEKSDSGGMPDGLNIDLSQNTKTTGLNFGGVKLAVPSDHEAKPAASTATTTKHTTPKITAPPAAAESISISISIGDEDTEIKATPTPVVTANPVVLPLKPKTPPPDAVTTIDHAPPEALETTIPEIKAQPQIVTQLTSAPAAAEHLEIEEASLKDLFAENKKHYEKLVFIQYNDQAKTATVKYWPQDITATETPTAHSIVADSFLAIVYKTQKSYHGYVVKNAITEKFFKEINSGQLPENITVVPIIKNDLLVGALMGWGPKSTYNLTVLREMEKSVQDLVAKFGWVMPEAA
jgi:hypothetical protein